MSTGTIGALRSIVVVSGHPERRGRLAELIRRAGFQAILGPPAARPSDEALLLLADGSASGDATVPSIAVVDGSATIDPASVPGTVHDSIGWDDLTPGRLRRAVRQALHRQRLRDRPAEPTAPGGTKDDLEQLEKVVSHDLNEPLAKMVGYADLVVSRHPDRAAARVAAGVLRTSLERFQATIDRLLSEDRSLAGNDAGPGAVATWAPGEADPGLESLVAESGLAPARPRRTPEVVLLRPFGASPRKVLAEAHARFRRSAFVVVRDARGGDRRWLDAGAADVLGPVDLDAWSLRRAVAHASVCRRLEEERTPRDFRQEFDRLARDGARALGEQIAPIERAATDFAEACSGLSGSVGRCLEVIESARRRVRLDHEALARFGKMGEEAGPPGPIDLGEVVAEVAALHAAGFGASGGRIDVAPLPVVTGRREPLVALFSHLFRSAIEYRSQAPPTIALASRPDGGSVLLTVRDDGVGLSSAAAAVRGRFRLGLIFCRRIVEDLGGTLEFDEHRHTGTLLEIRLAPA